MADVLFYGSGTALATPFSGGNIDFDAWERMLEFQLAEGSDALIVLGTTGEAPTVSFPERCALTSAAVRVARGKVPVIVSVGTNCTRMSVELAIAAKDAGADALLLSAPYYNKPTPPGIKTHFNAVADAANIPVILYNVPSRTGVNIDPGMMEELAKHPMIRGLKEASTDAAHISEMIARCGDGLAIYAGNDSQILSIMAQGGRGAITVLGNICPKMMHELTAFMIDDDIAAARAINSRISPLVLAMNRETNPGPVKCAMELLGICRAEMRPPMHCVSEDTRYIITEKLRECGV